MRLHIASRGLAVILIFVVAILVARGWLDSFDLVGLERPIREAPPVSGDVITPLVPLPDLSAEKVALGRQLFSDVRLSRDNTVSCETCHDLNAYGHDGKRVSTGVGGAQGVVNAPTVFNAALNFSQFWDGRARTLEEQAAGPIHNPVEMATTGPDVVAKLESDAELRSRFSRLYPEGLTIATLIDAIATFERTLITPNAPFDRYLLGERQAISEEAKKGFRRFIDLGCASCHQGVNVGGNMFQRIGIMADYFAQRPAEFPVVTADLGRFNVTGLDEDRYVFKVPSLRNVAVTAPYFHDGHVAKLAEAIRIMGQVQLGRDLSEEEVASLLAFLETLTGEPTVALKP